MDLLRAVVLGVVQGVTEFLPISSNAHLRVVPEFLGWPDPGAAFTAVIQLGTLVAVAFYFRHDIIRLTQAVWDDFATMKLCSSPESRTAWQIVIGTVPIVVLGLTLKKYIEDDFRQLAFIAWTTVAMSFMLMSSELVAFQRHKGGVEGKDLGGITWGDAIFIGLFQSIALIPGASRSGVTITAGLFAGLRRDTAARFSFLLSLPAVFAAGAYEMYKERDELLASQDHALSLLVATVVSAVVGYASIAWLIAYLKRHSNFGFVVYRLIFATAILMWLVPG